MRGATIPCRCIRSASIASARVSSPDRAARLGTMPDEPQPRSPGGPASPDPGVSTRRVLDRLGEAECMELLADGAVGRLVFNSRYGLTALPVALVIDGASLVLGTWDPIFDEDLRTGIEHADYQVAVEADQVNMEEREGWVVLVRGAAHHLDTESERAPFADAGLMPWLEGVPAHLIRVEPTTIYGVRARRE